ATAGGRVGADRFGPARLSEVRIATRSVVEDPYVRCQPPAAWRPPSTCTVVPVTNRARSPSRNTITDAASAGSANRPIGGTGGGRNRDSACTASASAASPWVGIPSGATELPRTPRSASSRARVRVRFSTAAFIAAYTEKPGAAWNASLEVTLTIEPPAPIASTTARVTSTTLVKFSSTSARSPLADESTNSARRSEEHTSELQSRENLVCRLP